MVDATVELIVRGVGGAEPATTYFLRPPPRAAPAAAPAAERGGSKAPPPESSASEAEEWCASIRDVIADLDAAATSRRPPALRLACTACLPVYSLSVALRQLIIWRIALFRI